MRFANHGGGGDILNSRLMTAPSALWSPMSWPALVPKSGLLQYCPSASTRFGGGNMPGDATYPRVYRVEPAARHVLQAFGYGASVLLVGARILVKVPHKDPMM